MTPDDNNFWAEQTQPQSVSINQPEAIPNVIQYGANTGVMPTIQGQPSTIPITQGIYSGAIPQTSAITAIILAVLSFTVCGVFAAIPAVIMSKQALQITDNFPNHPDAGMAKAAFIIGWINIALSIIGFIVMLVWIFIYFILL